MDPTGVARHTRKVHNARRWCSHAPVSTKGWLNRRGGSIRRSKHGVDAILRSYRGGGPRSRLHIHIWRLCIFSNSIMLLSSSRGGIQVLQVFPRQDCGPHRFQGTQFKRGAQTRGSSTHKEQPIQSIRKSNQAILIATNFVYWQSYIC